MSISVLRAGLLTTVQDKGRFGYRKEGVIVGGAMDLFALRIANLLVGNEEGKAALEVTLMGPSILFETETLISICGGNLTPSVGGKELPLWRPVYIQAGQMLEFGACQSGARAYVAIAGGIEVPVVMQSRSTYLRAGLGGLEGRALKEGDKLYNGTLTERSAAYMEYMASNAGSQPFQAADWYVGDRQFPAYAKNPVIRVLRGREFEWFTEESQETFFTAPFRVTSQSDRMGYRLKGTKLDLKAEKEVVSEAVTFGTIQVPAEGDPIILMADCQTVGGYPKIAQVVSMDLPVLAQVKPGTTVQFKEVSLQEAEDLYIWKEMEFGKMAKGIELFLSNI